jgi:hypothetical protein
MYSNGLASVILFLRVYALGGRGRWLKAYLIVHFVVRIATPMLFNNSELTVHHLSSFILGQLRWGSSSQQKFKHIVSQPLY